MSLELPDLIKRAERLLACVSVVLFLLISIASTRTQTFLCLSFFVCPLSLYAIICRFSQIVAALYLLRARGISFQHA
jgi:hypothetical protein